MMPLSYATPGEESVIRRIGGSPEVRKHLENLGFVVGGSVKTTSEGLCVNQSSRQGRVFGILVNPLVHDALKSVFPILGGIVGQGLVETVHLVVAEVIVAHERQGPSRHPE